MVGRMVRLGRVQTEGQSRRNSDFQNRKDRIKTGILSRKKLLRRLYDERDEVSK